LVEETGVPGENIVPSIIKTKLCDQNSKTLLFRDCRDRMLVRFITTYGIGVSHQ
jgi:hypothetical protein